MRQRGLAIRARRVKAKGALTVALVVTLNSLPVAALAQSMNGDEHSAKIVYTEESPNYQPTKYTLTIEESGAGHYSSHVGVTPASESGELAIIPLEEPIQLSRTTRVKLFQIARRKHLFAMQCDANGNRPHVQSTETLEYTGAEGKGRCSYVWSKDDDISEITDLIEGIQATVEEGARLGLIYKYQPLGLDKELERFAEQVQDKQALEITNIAPLL